MKNIKGFEEFPINEAKTSQKGKYGFTYFTRDWKESINEVLPDIRKFMKAHQGMNFEYFDAEWNDWNDSVYTVVTNYPKFESVGEDLGEDVFLGLDHADTDDYAVLWFNTPAELKKKIALGIENMKSESDQEDKDFAEFEKLGKKATPIYNKWLKQLNKMHDMKPAEFNKLGLPKRSGGWSIGGAAIWKTLQELGLKK